MKAAVLSLMTMDSLLDGRNTRKIRSGAVSAPVARLTARKKKRRRYNNSPVSPKRLQSFLSRIGKGILFLGQRDVDRLTRIHYRDASAVQPVENTEKNTEKRRQLEKHRIDRYTANGM